MAVPPITLTARNSWGRERTLTLRIEADGSATLHSPADGTLRITAEEVCRFSEELDLTLSAVDYVGGFIELTPMALIEPLEPVMLSDLGTLDGHRRTALRAADKLICEIYERRRGGPDQEKAAMSLGEVRRWLYRHASSAFWIEYAYQPIGTILSHAMAHLPPPVDTKNPSP